MVNFHVSDEGTYVGRGIALEGFTETLQGELNPAWNIKVRAISLLGIVCTVLTIRADLFCPVWRLRNRLRVLTQTVPATSGVRGGVAHGRAGP